LVGIALVVGGLIGSWFVHVAKDPEGLWITTEVEDSVRLGDQFDLIVKATNRLPDRDIALGDLDIPDTYLKGFSIVSVSPDPKSSAIDTCNECRTTRFGVSLRPGATAEFRFTLRAHRAGRHRGEITQYVGMQFISGVVETEVRR